MKIKLNGEPHDTADECSVGSLLDALSVVRGRVAVEVNLRVIRKADYDGCLLRDGDEVEIVNFVGGGSCSC